MPSALAYEQAIKDGVDVINFSIGGGLDDPWRYLDVAGYGPILAALPLCALAFAAFAWLPRALAYLQALEAQGLAGSVPVSGQDGDKAALNRVALGTQTVSVWKDSRMLGKKAGEVAVALAGGKLFRGCPAAVGDSPDHADHQCRKDHGHALAGTSTKDRQRAATLRHPHRPPAPSCMP